MISVCRNWESVFVKAKSINLTCDQKQPKFGHFTNGLGAQQDGLTTATVRKMQKCKFYHFLKKKITLPIAKEKADHS